MKYSVLYRLVQYITIYYLLSLFVVLLVEVNGVSGRPDVKTKLLLQNIRTRLAQKADEMIKEKECESGLILCKESKSKEEEGEEDRSEEIRPPPKLVRGQHKPLITVKPKDVIQTFMPKAHKSHHRNFQKTEESERHHKLSRHSDEEDSSEAKSESEEEISEKVPEIKEPISVNEPKFKRNVDLKPPKIVKKELKNAQEISEKVPEIKKPIIKNEPKFKQNVDLKPPKIEKKELKNEEDVRKVKKVSKNQPKEESPITGKDKTEVKEIKKIVKIKKEPKKAEENKRENEKELTDRAFIFPGGAFVFVLDSDSSHRNSCEKHSQIYLKQLQKYEIWALMMYDASAKLASGVLQGNTNQYGDFDECLSINAVFKKAKSKPKGSSGIKGKYCLANIDMRTDAESKGLRTIQERGESFAFIRSTIHDPGHFIPRFSTMNWGLCVPSACLAEDVERFLKTRFEVAKNASGLDFDVKVDEDNCVVKDDLKFKFHPETMATIMFYLTVLLISLYATFWDVKMSNLSEGERDPVRDCDTSGKTELSLKEKGKRIVMAFSLKKNVEKLLSVNNKGSIECINGIKSILTVLLYFAHKTIPLAMTPFSNRVVLTKISNQPVTVLLRASIVYTDSFLLISGILTAYSLTKEISEKKEISWMRKSVGRFIRLTPPLLAVVLFYAYIWDQLGSGPSWNLVVRRNSLLCRQYLWRNVFYIQNFFAFEEMCAPQTHQLALDMQLSLLAPLFVHLMQTYDKVGIGVLQALFILSSIMRYITTSDNNLSVVIYHGMTVAQLYKTANLLYVQAFHRASPYILGTVVGYHLKKLEKSARLPKAFAAFGWITAFAFGYYSLGSPYRLASRSYEYDVEEAAQYAALSPVAWSLALSWVVVACHLGFGGKLNEFLCQRIFLIFSRMSYSIYLTQFLVFFYKIGVKRIPETFTFASSFSVTESVLVIGVSAIVTILFDIPTMEIKKIILDENSPRTSLLQESSDASESFRKEEESGSEVPSVEDSQEVTEEIIENLEDEAEYDEETEEVIDEEERDDEEIDENNDEMSDLVFDLRPLRRSKNIRFSDEPEDKECFEPETAKYDD